MSMRFRKWIGGGAAIALASIALAGGACGGGGDDEPVADAPAGTCTAMIASNHVHTPHVVMVTSGDIMAAADKTYDIKGTAPHTHTITITAMQFATLQSGGPITVTSTTEETHSHMVTITC